MPPKRDVGGAAAGVGVVPGALAPITPRRRKAPSARNLSTRSDGAAACLSPERQPPVDSRSQSENRRYERRHVERVEGSAERQASGAEARGRRGPSPSRDLHNASEGVARVLSPDAQRPSSPPIPQRSAPHHHRYERRHHDGLASGAECPEPSVGQDAAGGSSSNHHVLTRFHNSEAGAEQLHHVESLQLATKTEDGTLRREKATRSPGRKQLSPGPGREGTTTDRHHHGFLGEKVAETADGWAAYRETRPGGGVEVSWRRTSTREHTQDHMEGTAFSTSHKSLSLAEVVSGTGDGCISSFNVGAPKWTQQGNPDTERLQTSSFTKHRPGEASEPDLNSPRSVFSRRRTAAEIEYGQWHREQSRRVQSQTKAGRGPPPTPQQWLQQKIREAGTIPAVASVLEPRELEDFMQQMAKSTIDELEVHNAEFSARLRRDNVVPQELKAWKFLQHFAQGCIHREVAKLDVIARAKTGSVPQTPQTPQASLDTPTALVEGLDAAFQAAMDDTPDQQHDLPTPVAEERYDIASASAATQPLQVGKQLQIDGVPDKATRKEMFEHMGENRSSISLEEIQKGIEQSYPYLDHRPAIRRAYKAADVNGEGRIDRREFRLFLEYLVFFSRSWQDLEAFGHDDNYMMNKSEFVAGCLRLGVLSAEDADEEFHVVDRNNGGYVFFEEFCCLASIHKIGETKQLWPKYKTEPAVQSDLGDHSSISPAQQSQPNRHARVVSPEKGGRLSKPNRIWVNNKWQDSPQTAAMPTMDRVAGRLLSPTRSRRTSGTIPATADATGGLSLTSPDRHKPHHQLTSPERRTLRNRESARQAPGGDDGAAGADASLAVTLTGVWDVNGETRDGTKVKQRIYIKHTQDGRVTGGHVDSVNGFFVIKDGTVDGSTVWFRQEYSNSNRVVWEATIKRTYVSGTSGIMIPKLVEGTWKGSLQGSFSAGLEATVGSKEGTGSAASTLRRKKKTAASARTAGSTPQHYRRKQQVSAHADVDDDSVVGDLMSGLAEAQAALTDPQNLSGTWIASGSTADGWTRGQEMFVLNHDPSSGGIHGHSMHEADDEDGFVIIGGELEGRTVKFTQKFHDGAETFWEAKVRYSSTGARARLEDGIWWDNEDGVRIEGGTFTAELKDESKSQRSAEPEPELEPEIQRARQLKMHENAKALLEQTPKHRPRAKTPSGKDTVSQNGTPHTGRGARTKSPFLRKGTGAGGAGSAAAGRYSRASSPTKHSRGATSPQTRRPSSRSGKMRSSGSSGTPHTARTAAARSSSRSATRSSGQKSYGESQTGSGSGSTRRGKETKQPQQSAIELQLQREGVDRSDLM